MSANKAIKQAIYNLEKRWAKYVRIGTYNTGTVDYSNAVKSTSTKESRVKAIYIPTELRRSFVKNTELSIETFDISYIIKIVNLDFSVKPGDYVVDNGKRYDVKTVTLIEDTCIFINCKSVEGTPDES